MSRGHKHHGLLRASSVVTRRPLKSVTPRELRRHSDGWQRLLPGGGSIEIRLTDGDNGNR